MTAPNFTYRAVLLAAMTISFIAGCGVDKPTDPPPPPVSDNVFSVNGNFFKAVMGDTITDRSLNFAVRDKDSKNLPEQWLYFDLLSGDGTLSADSIKTDANGIAHLTYAFDSLLGHAEIQFLARDIDTSQIQIRANTLVPGIGGQAQYILFEETYLDCKNYNGQPNSVDDDPRPEYIIVYANYESSLHVVFVIDDRDLSNTAEDSSQVLTIILTSGYTGKTKDSIGIGSTLNEIKAVYGPPDSIFFDAAQPPALGVVYGSEGLLFFIDTVTPGTVDTNTAAFEIHMDDFITNPAPTPKNLNQSASFENYRRLDYRRYRK
ncbi:MAG: hypothetical protein IIC66_06270 [candidate division Zixibacteria bacterium]|nr:hypothetical protein [candidate division Zixibacteria bacterium]